MTTPGFQPLLLEFDGPQQNKFVEIGLEVGF